MATHETVFRVTHRDDALPAPADLTTDRRAFCPLVAQFFETLGAGWKNADLVVERDAVAATAAILLELANGDLVVTLGGYQATFDSSGFADDDECALALAEYLTNAGDLAEAFSFEAQGASVIVTALQGGAFGNFVTISVSGTGISTSQPTLTGGVNGTTAKASF